MDLSLSELADPDRSWPTYRIYFTPSRVNPIPHLDVLHVHGPNDDRLLHAVLEHVRPHWPGAMLEVRVNRALMRGRIFAGGRPGRRVGSFVLMLHGPGGPPPPPPPPGSQVPTQATASPSSEPGR